MPPFLYISEKYNTMEIIKNLSSIEISLILWFVGFIIHQQFNIAYRLKRLFKIKVTKSIKPLDCYPCFTFWLALAISLSPIHAMTAYVIALIIDKR